MKDVIEEERKKLVEFIESEEWGLVEGLDMRQRLDEAFLKIANEADFIINRLQGEAGIVERAAEKLPNTSELLLRWAQVLRGYAARVENSEAPEFNKRSVPVSESNIIAPPEFGQ